MKAKPVVPRERVHRITASISDKRIEQILDYLEYIRIKEVTEEIVNDQKLMASIQKGMQELKAGEIFSLDEMKNVLYCFFI